MSQSMVNNEPKTKGSLIDIDTLVLQVPDDFDKSDGSMDRLFDDMHRSSKELFFKMLSPEFLLTLNPEY